MSGRDDGRGDERAPGRLGLVGVDGKPVRLPPEQRRQARATQEALQAAQAGAAEHGAAAGLSPADHEALIALTLGSEASGVTPLEHEAAERLRRELEGVGGSPLSELAQALAAAQRGAETDGAEAGLDAEEHEALIALTLGSEASGVTPLEHEAAERLRRELEGVGGSPLSELAQAVRAAAGLGRGLDELSAERVLRGVLRGGSMGGEPRQARRRVATLGAAAGALVALAAGLALLLGPPAWLETRGRPQATRPLQRVVPSVALLRPRSTALLFDPLTPFAAKGGESDRLGRIVASRAADLRANRFSTWGVQ